jgi:hypothetical protein
LSARTTAGQQRFDLLGCVDECANLNASSSLVIVRAIMQKTPDAPSATL